MNAARIAASCDDIGLSTGVGACKFAAVRALSGAASTAAARPGPWIDVVHDTPGRPRIDHDVGRGRCCLQAMCGVDVVTPGLTECECVRHVNVRESGVVPLLRVTGTRQPGASLSFQVGRTPPAGITRRPAPGEKRALSQG